MAGNEPSARPRSPHLQVYKWTPAMAVSILHRASGDGLAIVGACMFLWWLGALAAGPDAYAAFLACVWHDPSPEVGIVHQITNIVGKVVLVGLTWAFFQHLFSGLRHFVLDTGAGYELKTNKLWSIAVITAGVLATAATWLYIMAEAL
ncbi:MAG: succinate dehydrogenase, cytochrome b556 subunit [Sphingopyxis sp.]|jgi:succinate dehydrogenase / fumarate reductase cytochrome b subunit|uniref:succinate dehydrogenase, cytochrome b556 subunit n=1 Tax=unclassified Sphingopyxis TaxID=2614943 RepID=UPI0010F7EC1D|nr:MULTISPECIES: succinate dehydrogenase, cytochrome b556 subunit [unclassified Sphingopyxis]MBR2173382.1 succinate dehydrogenase, cytochrome b556 subunit [Sphingopyxis sp.]